VDVFEKLRAPFPREIVSWRIGATSGDKTTAIGLAYVDARDVMQRLDDAVGTQNWQALYPHANGKTSCKIGIYIPGSDVNQPCGEWVWKENGCGDSDIEAAKGAFSDALKRAAVLWGIGRYLYDVPNVWVDIVPAGRSHKFKNPQDPKLMKALEQAEKGIRLPPEPEPTIIPVDGEEFLLMQNEIKGCENVDQLKSTWEKINLAKPRLNDDQYKALGKTKDEKKTGLIAIG